MADEKLADLALNAGSGMPLYQQLYQQVRGRILRGELAAGEKLPATRTLAARCGISRVTVVAAYEQLAAEGFVESRVGAGTYVASLPVPGFQEAAASVALAPWGARLREAMQVAGAGGRTEGARAEIDFGFGRTFASLFPYDVWRRLLARYLSTDDALLSRYGSPAGFEPLREAIAAYVARARGVRCLPEQVVVVSGAQQALDIVARLLVAPGEAVVVETPGYLDAYQVFRLHGAALVGVAVDDGGMPTEHLTANVAARLAFVTPAHQFPRGGTMPLARRLQLLRWAAAQGAMVIEDDYDSELRYRGRPPMALQGLDDGNRVVYLGTFSKVLFPALRLGYAVLPEALCEPFVGAMRYLGRGAPTLAQAAVADFITEGHFERHVAALRAAYGARRGALVAALARHMGEAVQYSRDEAGLHVMVYLPLEMDESWAVAQAAAAGVAVYPGARYHLGTPPAPSVLLGFSGLTAEEIEEGVARLAEALMLT
jgi:GntR family transcriptional regulator/MocR family aminotransferase